MKTATHYAGALSYTDARGRHHEILGGWAACCSGPRAEQIRAQGRNTFVRANVTCGACLRAMRRANGGEL